MNYVLKIKVKNNTFLVRRYEINGKITVKCEIILLSAQSPEIQILQKKRQSNAAS